MRHFSGRLISVKSTSMGIVEISAINRSAATSDTSVERVAVRIHHDILTGSFAPGAKLRIHELARRYHVGPTPIREALSRLCAHGFVQATANRGFRVSSVSREDLEDIIGTRLSIELEALRLSIAKGGDEWEANILAALHRFQKFIERDSDAFGKGVLEYDRVHKFFHTTLISACGLRRLIEMHEALYDQTYRYRCVALRAFKPHHPIEAHAKLARFAIQREVKPACEELARQIKSVLHAAYPETEISEPAPRRKVARSK
jgi:GntR family transcriptional regulator, carbon starvation induced regulator